MFTSPLPNFDLYPPERLSSGLILAAPDEVTHPPIWIISLTPLGSDGGDGDDDDDKSRFLDCERTGGFHATSERWQNLKLLIFSHPSESNNNKMTRATRGRPDSK